MILTLHRFHPESLALFARPDGMERRSAIHQSQPINAVGSNANLLITSFSIDQVVSMLRRKDENGAETLDGWILVTFDFLIDSPSAGTRLAAFFKNGIRSLLVRLTAPVRRFRNNYLFERSILSCPTVEDVIRQVFE